MSQLQEHVPRRLVTFIQSIQLRRRSGLLSAKRGEGTGAEEGAIVFVNGQITEAKVGRYCGSEAFNRLSTWENCQFSFVLQPSSQQACLNLMDTGATTMLASGVEPDTSHDTQLLTSVVGRESRHDPETPPYLSPFAFTPEYLRGVGAPRSSRDLSAALQMIEQMGLSRTHRRLFLLIDGKRSVDELAPLIGRTPEEVSELLCDLERASVIQVPNAFS